MWPSLAPPLPSRGPQGALPSRADQVHQGGLPRVEDRCHIRVVYAILGWCKEGFHEWRTGARTPPNDDDDHVTPTPPACDRRAHPS
eukprot:1433953-Prymnesium_polylepis.1